jgi:prophage regulatory protein
MSPQKEPLRAVRLPEVVRLTGLRRSTLRKLQLRGLFPPHYSITDRAVAWRSDEVNAWLAQRLGQSQD